jgi:hypothetical protein
VRSIKLNINEINILISNYEKSHDQKLQSEIYSNYKQQTVTESELIIVHSCNTEGFMLVAIGRSTDGSIIVTVCRKYANGGSWVDTIIATKRSHDQSA